MSDSFVIITDSTSDLSEEFQKAYDIVVIPGHLTLPDQTEIEINPKWDHFTKESFYSHLKNFPNDFKTAPPNAMEYENIFRKYASKGMDILFSTISHAISGAFSFATLARENVLKDYPDVQICMVDSLRFGPAIGLLLIKASEMRKTGASLIETQRALEEKKNGLHQAGWLDDLSFVAKKGRITHASAFMGTLVGIKPLGEFDHNGLTTVIGKARGAKTAYVAMMSYMEQTIINPQDQIIFIAQTGEMKEAMKYKEMIEEKFNPREVHIVDVFPACGVNVGPGLMASYYFGKPISSDLSKERNIIKQAMETK